MYLNEIKARHNIEILYKLDGGYSLDEKYHFYNDGHFTLKIYDIKEIDNVKKRMDLMKLHFDSGVKCPQVIHIGEIEDKCYSIVTFIEGDTGQSISKYSDTIQYEIGVTSGKELKKMHEINVNEPINVYELHKNKFNTIKNEIESLGLRVVKHDYLVNYIKANIHLLKGRPSKLLHGDYHLENSVFDNSGYIGCFDYNRVKLTDPLRDFERICVFSREIALPYVKGVLDGYGFNKEDFKILKLYLAMGIFNATLWTHKLYPEDMDYNNKLARMVLDDYNNFILDIPKWYG